jgi:hypothetical protein
MARKQKFTEADLKNDPSLRWCPYRMWELVWSDVHNKPVRFVRYEDGKVRVGTLNGMAPLPELVEVHQVRRPSVMDAPRILDDDVRKAKLHLINEDKRKRQEQNC